MSLLEGFRDSRTGRDGGERGLPISGTAAPLPDAAAAGATPRETEKNGHDVVFALVFALYCYQQRRRQQGEQGRRRRGVSSAGGRGADGDTDGDGDGGGERLDAIGRIVACGEGGINSRSSQTEASPACSAAAVSVVASGAAAPCDVDLECEAEMLVTELQDARRLHLRDVEFYLPQLCMIIGLGDFTHPRALVEFLLDLCQSDLRLAHKIHWFLKSYCPVGGSPDALKGLASFALRVQKRGCAVASRLSKTLARQALVIPASDRGVSRAQAGDGRCKAETEAWADAESDNGGGFGGEIEAEPAAGENRGFVPSVCRRSERNEGGGAEQEEEEEEEDAPAEHYDPAMFFVEALLGLAEELGSLSAKKRAEGLQKGLERINEFFLSEMAKGSDVIYVPFGEGFHQIRAIHPRESMHFSTKERVPLLVCLEVQRVHVPTAIIRSAAKAARATGSTPNPTPGSATVAGRCLGETELATETDEGMHGGEADHAGEAGLMERFRGTVRAFVKLRSDDGDAREDSQRQRDEEPMQGSTEHEDSAPPLVRLGATIEVDECSSRTASEPDLGNSRDSTSSSDTGGGISSSRRPPSAPAGKLRDFSTVGEGRAKTGVNDSCSENDYEDEDGEDDHDRRGADRLDYDDHVDKGGGASSQGGVWYGEGGGAGALEAALGQWGGYLDVTVAADATSGDEEGTGSCDRGVGGDGVTPRVGGTTLARHGDHYPPLAVVSVACVAGVGTGAGAGGDTLDPEDDSWEIVEAPEQWEGHSNPSAAAGCGDVGSGSGSDSFSEYLAAAEAEQRDSQLAAEAEEEEQAKLKAEVEAETQLASPPGVPPPTKRKGAVGEGATGNTPDAAAAGAKPVGRSYFAPVAGAARGVVGHGRRRRRRPGLAGQPRIVFKEHWREKELRVWREGRAVVAAAREGASKNASVRSVTAAQSTESSGNEPGVAEGIESGGASPWKGWKLLPIIVKANDDLTQEQFVSHLVAVFDQIFSKADLGARLRPYEIMATSPTAGVMEAIPDTVSLDALKRHTHHLALHVFFRRHFGRKGMLRQARANFVGSCAAYSVVCYLLQIKDRHNGNILLSADGHLIHIDWGFALDLSPGGNLRFESAPFKLTQDFVEVMGGARSASFQKYRSLCVRAFLEARRNRQKIITLVEMMMAFRPDLACFGGRPEVVLKHLRARFQPEKSPETCVTFVHELIQQSVDNWRTRLYDTYQRAVVGIQ